MGFKGFNKGEGLEDAADYGSEGMGIEREMVMVERVRWWEMTAREYVLKIGAEVVRQRFFERLHDSTLGVRLKGGIDARLERYGKEVSTNPEALLGVAANAVLEAVPRMSYDDRFSEKRRVDDPESIAANGGLCVEMSLAAEAALHLAYSLNPHEPNFNGYTQQVLLRTMGEGGVIGHHSVLKMVCKPVFGYESQENQGEERKEYVLFCDPINGVVGRWEDLLSGVAYQDLDGRPVAVVHELKPIDLIR